MKSNPLLLLIFCLAVGGSAVFAQSVEELGVGRPSSFQYSEVARDPLWPIGWVKKAPVDAVVTPGSTAPVLVEVMPKPDSFYVSSISLDRIPLAVINGKAYGVGDYFLWSAPVEKGNKSEKSEKGEPKTLRLQVVSIRDGIVVLRYGTMEFNCPLRINTAPAPSPKPASK